MSTEASVGATRSIWLTMCLKAALCPTMSPKAFASTTASCKISILEFQLCFEALNFLKGARVCDGRSYVVGDNQAPWPEFILKRLACGRYYRAQCLLFVTDRINRITTDALFAHPVGIERGYRLLVQIRNGSRLAAYDQVSDRRHSQRFASGLRVKPPKSFPGPDNGCRFRRNQVQAAGLVGTIGATRAGGAQVTLFNQPDLNTDDVRPFHHVLDEFSQELRQRLLVRNPQQQLRDEIGIEAIIASWFHNQTLPERSGRSKSQKTIFCAGSFF